VLALVLIASYLLVTFWVIINVYYVPSIQHSYQVVSTATFNATVPIILFPDVTIDLAIQYNNSIIVSQPVKINATAELQTPMAIHGLVGLQVTIQNALLYPESFDSAGIPKPATMRIARQGNETVLRGTMTAYWPASGNFLPLYAFYFADGSSYVAIDERNSIQVLPPESSTEQQATRLSRADICPVLSDVARNSHDSHRVGFHT
jgi:reverse gyrase